MSTEFTWKTMGKEDVMMLADSIQRRGKTLQADIHTALMASINHARQHGDITLLNAVLAKIPAMSRRDAVGKWVCQLEAIAVTKDQESGEHVFKQSKKGGLLGITDDEMNMLDSTPFWLLKTASDDIKPIDVKARIANLIKQINKPDANIKLDGALEECRALLTAVEDIARAKAPL